MKLSVVIPCYNAAATISVQLEALAIQQWHEPWEVVVVNNRSTDESMAIAERYRPKFPHFRVVEALERQSRPYARNVGVRAAAAQAVAFCDADDEVAPGWIAAMGEALTNQCDFVACSIDLLKLNPPWLGAMRSHAQTTGLQKIWYPPYLFHAGGGTLGVRRMVHDAIGGFDESLAVLEDTDYCFRIQLAGFQLQFVKDAVMHVRIRDSWSALFNQSRMWAEYNVRVYRKYRKYSGTFVRQQWRRYVSDWINMIRQLPNLRQRRAWAPFIWTLGWQIGLLQGSIKYRVEPVPFS